jgi:hypothetical protein
MKNSDDDLEALRSLPVRDADRAVADDVRATALVAFDAAHGRPAARYSYLAMRLWSRFGVPAGLAVVVFVYLRWAFAASLTLYH